MIVVDTNVIAYLLIAGQHTSAARATLLRDPEWAAPLLWRSELRNVLALYLRRRQMSVAEAVTLCITGEALLAGREHVVTSRDVLALANESGRSAYDCEFIAVARQLKQKLVTSDRSLLASFPDDTVALDAFGIDVANI
ncbi:type II toxin-antitoxin system VapC family toxin [soil metagenome]